jgi:hypothetical protein
MDNLAYLAAVVNEEPGPSGWISRYDPACKGQAKPVLYQTQILSSATKEQPAVGQAVLAYLSDLSPWSGRGKDERRP